jgi:hypothetical protein
MESSHSNHTRVNIYDRNAPVAPACPGLAGISMIICLSGYAFRSEILSFLTRLSPSVPLYLARSHLIH